MNDDYRKCFSRNNTRWYLYYYEYDNGYIISDTQIKKITEKMTITKCIQFEPTDAMREAGAQRLVRFEGKSKWPDSFSPLDRAAARNDAERVWKSMFLAAKEDSNK